MGRDDWDEATKAADVLPGEDLTAGPHPEKAYLIVLTGSRLGSMVELRDGLVLGRSHTTDFQVPEEGVSRQHVRILTGNDGKLVLEDMGSLNGTYVNGKRIQAAVLADGDKIRVGTTTILKFSYADRLEEHFQQQLREAALRDPLTRIFNRRSLDDHLTREVAFARRHGSALSMILFDIDHFKNVNDTYGHPAGDELLCALAVSLGRQIRQEDILARYGGEEFALICRGITGEIAYTVGDRLRMSIASQQLVPQLPQLQVTISGGVAAMPAIGIDSERELVEAADQCLYQAKNAGRNRVVLHPSALEPPPTRPPRKRAPSASQPVRGVIPDVAAMPAGLPAETRPALPAVGHPEPSAFTMSKTLQLQLPGEPADPTPPSSTTESFADAPTPPPGQVPSVAKPDAPARPPAARGQPAASAPPASPRWPAQPAAPSKPPQAAVAQPSPVRPPQPAPARQQVASDRPAPARPAEAPAPRPAPAPKAAPAPVARPQQAVPAPIARPPQVAPAPIARPPQTAAPVRPGTGPRQPERPSSLPSPLPRRVPLPSKGAPTAPRPAPRSTDPGKPGGPKKG